MIYSWVQSLLRRLFKAHKVLLVLLSLLFLLGFWGTPTAEAGIDDDLYDGNIFVLYASNGSIVPAKVDLATSQKKNRPAILAFYVDDSRDCKKYSIVISQLQAFYGKTTSLIAISADTILPEKTYTPSEAPYYYAGAVPQVVVLDGSGEVVLNEIGPTPFEEVDNVLRDVFDLPPRTEPLELERPDFSPSPSADTTFWTAPLR